MNRRNFLKTTVLGATGLALLGVSGVAAQTTPILYADGIHDDTAALNVWGGGERVVWADGSEVGRVISNKEFRITDTIRVGRVQGGHPHLYFQYNRLLCDLLTDRNTYAVSVYPHTTFVGNCLIGSVA